MAAKNPKTEPLQPGDEQIAREEIEAHYTDQLVRAAKELEEARRRFEAVSVKTRAALAAFRSGERLPEIDAWSIEVNAGNVAQLGSDLLAGRSTDREAYDRARERQQATRRWLRAQGYESIDERHS